MNLEEMWQRLAQHQPLADKRGYGKAWARMCKQRTREAALAAADAAWVRRLPWTTAWAVDAAWAAAQGIAKAGEGQE